MTLGNGFRRWRLRTRDNVVVIHEMLLDNDAYPFIGMLLGILGALGFLTWLGFAIAGWVSA